MEQVELALANLGLYDFIPIIKNHCTQKDTPNFVHLLDQYFHKKRRDYVQRSNVSIEILSEAADIITIIPTIGMTDVLRRLEILYDVPKRPEIVLRQFIREKVELMENNMPSTSSNNVAINIDRVLKSETYTSVNDNGLKDNKICKHQDASEVSSPNFDDSTTFDLTMNTNPAPLDSSAASESYPVYGDDIEIDLMLSSVNLPEIPKLSPNSMQKDDDADIINLDEDDGSLEFQYEEKHDFIKGLAEVFPDAELEYIAKLVDNKELNNNTFNEVITTMIELNGNYPKRAVTEKCTNNQENPDTLVRFEGNAFDVLTEYLPDADPDFLKYLSQEEALTTDKLKEIINHALEHQDYPKLKDYQRRQQLSAQKKKYTTNFCVADFVEVIPDPLKTFGDPQRKPILDAYSLNYAKTFLQNMYPRLPIRVITSVFKANEGRLYAAITNLDQLMRDRKSVLRSSRKKINLNENIANIPILQEIAFITHKDEILAYIDKIKHEHKQLRLIAKATQSLYTCQCCYNDDLLSNEVFQCSKGCLLCKTCITKSCELKLTEGSADCTCVLQCEGGVLPLTLLQRALKPNIFSKFARKQATAEIKASLIDGLECCPFCDFMYIPADDDKLFHCLNEECMTESCRECKEPNHIPFKCDEIERDADVKARVFIENEMSEALMRQCYKCGLKFLKEDGCNKMTCKCGAKMCYVCKQPVKDYTHFNGQGGDRHNLCPLYSDTDAVHQQDVLQGAKKAKQELGNVELKNDPTSNTMEYFNRITTRKRPRGHHNYHFVFHRNINLHR